jgi:hypothetical protein
MSDSAVPPTPEQQAGATPSTRKVPAAQHPAYDEFGTAKRNLPPAAPVAVAIALVALVVAVIAYMQRAKPAAQGSIDGVWFSQPAGMPTPMVLIELTLRNVSEKTLYIEDIKATVKTDQGEQSDDDAAASDFDRYLMAYPDLRGHATPLKVETKILPEGEQRGSVMVTFPVTQQQFDARKDLTVTIQPYDQRAIVLHEKSGAGK